MAEGNPHCRSIGKKIILYCPVLKKPQSCECECVNFPDLLNSRQPLLADKINIALILHAEPSPRTVFHLILASPSNQESRLA